MSVLIVDDDQLIIKIVEKILTKLQFVPIAAENGYQAVEVLEKNQDDIEFAIIDMTMPGMNGFETVSKLREIKPNLTCVISSGQYFSESEIPDEIKNNLHFLQKPYHVATFMDFVSNQLKLTV